MAKKKSVVRNIKKKVARSAGSESPDRVQLTPENASLFAAKFLEQIAFQLAGLNARLDKIMENESE